MTVSKINIDAHNKKDILAFLAINHPTHKWLNEKEYQFQIEGKPYVKPLGIEFAETKAVTLILENGVSLKLPISAITKPNVSVIAAELTNEDCVDLTVEFNDARKEKFTGLSSEKVLSYANFEIRNGVVHRRNDKSLIGEGNVYIIKA